MTDVLPEFARTAFRLGDAPARPLGVAWGNGWQVGPLVVSRTYSAEEGSWSAKVREKLQVPGLRIARPTRSTDGRFVVSGWRASGWIPGELERRADETVAAAWRLDQACADVAIPPFVSHGSGDTFAQADRQAWGEETGIFLADRLIELSGPAKDIGAATQICHADVQGCLVYSGSLAPGLTDLVPVARPQGYSAALAIVDALIAGHASLGIIDRFAFIPDVWRLCQRAAAYRIVVHETIPDAVGNASSNLERVYHLLAS